ncbi:NnrS family protein [Paraburkholderia sp.]|uniref:NnrS family protein n=1 Tax=Paraburkholderia sp. TaxID=1926495 RepID=UPI0039C99005
MKCGAWGRFVSGCALLGCATCLYHRARTASAWSAWWIDAAGLCWCAAFALYARHYWPCLTRPRIDGQAG